MSYVLVDRISPPAARTEAFAWISTAVACGSALGGILVEYRGGAEAFALAMAGGGLGVVAALRVRRLLRS